ncbi:PREDICTED: small nuclear ribonucleoprotein G-like [Corvus brachyrhynchos]|uniref:small nuclear ribonucleoprotein G-like n=1 Tax=Corvus brachyrhynchos TaxID=85066 RepID=UPI0008163F68|nr:PREDICTED: small nuclear ribonucleoprotein G-like [Corvus brachyrhynchos]
MQEVQRCIERCHAPLARAQAIVTAELEHFQQPGFPAVKLNGGRHVQGILRGFDPFMNLVIDECVEMAPGGQQNNIGMVVIRGNSIIMLEALERV